MTFPIPTYNNSSRSCSIQFHTLCIPLRSGTGYNRPRRGAEIEEIPPAHLHPQNSPVESLDPAAPRARATDRGNLARGIETRRALVRARVSLRGSFSGFN